ncbi:hypothetical protein [Saccharopolyspora hattusasensis]|uniref:hypothetical protein n=1 Tax=Saccharopolyspora hattusasensis TaxID=1128679 RepID=UPI003D980C2B
MFTQHGIAVDAWVRIEPDCPMRHQVVADELQIEFGTRMGALSLVVTDEAVEKLVAVLSKAQAQFGSEEAGGS